LSSDDGRVRFKAIGVLQVEAGCGFHPVLF
jgi:hypothetical protein